MRTKALNVKFKVGQKVVCTWGTNKGKEFIIEVVLAKAYSCSLVGGDNSKYYEYDDNTLEAV